MSQARESCKDPTLLKLDELDEGLAQWSFAVGAAELELGDDFFSFPEPLRVSLKVARALETFRVEGEVRCAIEGECCRCLKRARARVVAPVHVLVQRKQASAEELEALADEEDIEIVDPGVKEVDFKARLGEVVALELPMRLYCRKDCKGLCPQCGCDLNEGPCTCKEEKVDLRWEVLAKLKN